MLKNVLPFFFIKFTLFFFCHKHNFSFLQVNVQLYSVEQWERMKYNTMTKECSDTCTFLFTHQNILTFQPLLPQVNSDSDTVIISEWQKCLLDSTLSCQRAVTNQALSPSVSE